MNFDKVTHTERKKQNMSLKRLSELSGVPISTIHNYEKGINPTLSQADKILTALGVTMVLGEVNSEQD